MSRPLPEGFTPWTGGANPCPTNLVEIVFHDGDRIEGRSTYFSWNWTFGGAGADIVGYRITGDAS